MYFPTSWRNSALVPHAGMTDNIGTVELLLRRNRREELGESFRILFCGKNQKQGIKSSQSQRVPGKLHSCHCENRIDGNF